MNIFKVPGKVPNTRALSKKQIVTVFAYWRQCKNVNLSHLAEICDLRALLHLG